MSSFSESNHERGKEFVIKMIELLKEYPEVEISTINTYDISISFDGKRIYPINDDYTYGGDDLATALEKTLEKLNHVY